MILIIDNYDSFTYNIVQLLRMVQNNEVVAVRNDACNVKELQAMQPQMLVISSGAGYPAQAGISCDAIRDFAEKIPVLGIGLGHLAIGKVYGAEITKAPVPMHGKTGLITGNGQGVYKGVQNPFKAMYYHSLLLAPETIPDCLQVTATAEDGAIMGIRHVTLPVEGFQFHPESIMTSVGRRLLRNFVTKG